MTDHGSYWLASAPAAPDHPALFGAADCQVAVLGAGIAGLTTAYLLARAGVDVVVLEAAGIGAGATGHTTAKVSSAHGLCYAPLRKRHSAETAAAYAELNEQAIDLIEEIAAREGIECGWRRRDNYTYTVDPDRERDIADEAQAAAEAGLDAQLVSDTPLPFDVVAAVRVSRQAEFHSVEWLLGLAAAAERAGARIHEHSRAVNVSAGSPCQIATEGGAELRAEQVVVATHYPILDRALFFARLSAQRSYCIGMRAPGPPPDGMFLSIDEPTRSVRSHPLADGGELLIVGGEGHKVGQDEHTGERYAALEAWAAEHFGAPAPEYRWSAQDPMPPDDLPYVGAYTPRNDRLFVATGFRKWGMTNGTAAAAVLRDTLLGHDIGAGKVFDANRFDPVAAGPKIAKEGADVAKHYARTAVHLLAGRSNPRCTHMGCELQFNEAERSWDCPCHGSRFDAEDGRVLEGPAVDPITPTGD